MAINLSLVRDLKALEKMQSHIVNLVNRQPSLKADPVIQVRQRSIQSKIDALKQRAYADQ